MSLSEDIKEFALDLGYSRVGITTSEAFTDYIVDLKARNEMYGWYIRSAYRPLVGADPKVMMPSAKSIVVVVYDGSKKAFPDELVGKIGRLYQSRCYLTPGYRISGARRHLMRDFLERNGMEVARRLVVPERLAAARAGIITYGKNTFAFAHGIGSFILITSYVVDIELEYDQPTMVMDCPPNCTVCLDVCPTGAIYEPQKIDSRLCIAYNTFITQDDFIEGVNSYIPPKIREKMGTWIHGCDICQQVCPRNMKRLKANLPPDEYLERIAKDFELTKLLNLTDEYYEKRVQPLMYNYIREKKYFQRNAAIALGNLGDPAFIPDLGRAMENPESMVRGYAAWALGRIGSTQAKRILERRLKDEVERSVKREIDSALATL
jgi:epoxyqueuosine reductase